MTQPPAIVLPGITGAQLDDHYPVDPDEVWTAIEHKDFERIALHPDNLALEAVEPARIVTRNVFGIAYGDFVEALRHELRPNPAPGDPNPSKPVVPVFAFAYDWRVDMSLVAARLGPFIEEVLARTALLPHYRQNPPRSVDLIGHSSGGLVIAKYLRDRQLAKTPSRVNRVVTIGTDFRGSMSAVSRLATGKWNRTGDEPRDRERDAARVIPHVYQLMPTYPGAVFSQDGLSKDLFKAATWQPSILRTLRIWIASQQAQADALTLFQGMLDRARSFIDEVNALDPAKVLPRGADDWLPITGVDAMTRITVFVRKDDNGDPRFDFEDAVNDWKKKSVRTGDGTVPFLGAVPDFLGVERAVCVRPSDLEFTELKDKLLVELGGMHAFLPKMNLVQRLVIKFLREEFSGEVWANKPPGVTAPRWPAWLSTKP